MRAKASRHRQAGADQGLGVGDGGGGGEGQLQRPRRRRPRGPRGRRPGRAGLRIGLGQARADGGGGDQVASIGPGLAPASAKALSGSRWKASRAPGEALATAPSQSAAWGPRKPASRPTGASSRITPSSTRARSAGRADRDAGLAGRVDAHDGRGRAALQVGQDLGVGAGRIGMGGEGARRPRAGRRRTARARSGGRGGRRIERRDRQAFDGGLLQALEGRFAQGLVDQGAPVGLGGGRESRRRERAGRRPWREMPSRTCHGVKFTRGQGGGLHARAALCIHRKCTVDSLRGTPMALPPVLRDRLRLPVIGSPLFIISDPDLVIAQCKAGIVGSFPALNARPVSHAGRVAAPDHRGTGRLGPRPSGGAVGAVRGQPDRPQDQRPAGAGRRAIHQVEGADRHHLAGRARGRERRGPLLWRRSCCTT